MTARDEPILPAEKACAGAVVTGTNARADFAAAAGRCEAGERVTIALDADALPRVLDLLGDAARAMLPLVVRTDRDGSDAALFAAADAGACVLLATPADLATTHLVARLLAERSLLPVVLACPSPKTDEAASAEALPREARALLGDPADFVPASTPAQKLLFGKDRRRVVRWFDLERPVLRGQPLDEPLRRLQLAGTPTFVHDPVPQVLAEITAEVKRTGLTWSAVEVQGTAKAEVIVAGLAGSIPDLSEPLRDLLTQPKKPRIGFVTLRCLRPFDDSWIDELAGRRALIALSSSDEAFAGSPPLLREIRAALGRSHGDPRGKSPAKAPSMHVALTGPGGDAARPDDLAVFVRECLNGQGRSVVHLGVEFAPLGGTLRKRQVLHEGLRRAHPGIEYLGIRTAKAAAGPAVPQAPLRLAAPAQPKPTHDDPTRCWDTIAAAAATGRRDELAPDPYLTAATTPALTSLFRGNAAGDMLPTLDAAACTGCGACWTACPDGALLPSVIGARELLDYGMRAAGGALDAGALQPLLPRIAKALPKTIAGGEHRACDAIRAAAAKPLSKLGADRREAAQAAIDTVANAIGLLPLAVPEPFAGDAVSVFALALDPDACKGCNLCVAVCEPEALAAEARTDEGVTAAREMAATWRALPDTPGKITTAARELPEPGLLGALQLSRHCLLSLAPGDDAEPGSGARIALRSVLAAAEAHLQPKLLHHCKQVDELGDEFGQRIRELLAGGLPDSDLEALHEGLVTLGQGAVTLSTLASSLDSAAAGGRVDTPKLQRHVETARAIADLRFRIAQGTTGRGRSRAGLLLTGGEACSLVDHFPWNPFAMPAVFDGSPEAGHRAAGLAQGATAAMAADFALLRRARALLQQGAPGPRRLSFEQLTTEERQLCPPLWFVADSSLFRQGGLQQLATAFSGDLPVKVLLVSSSADACAATTAPLLALSHRNVFVLQTSIAHRDHLAAGVLAASAHQGPALVHVLAPSPRAHGAGADQAIALAAAAVESREFPLLSYDPRKTGAFGQKLSLEGNPDPTADGTDDLDHLEAWRTLQELAGVRTPFTAEVEQRAAADTATEHERELTALRAEHAAALGAARGEVEEELVTRLQRKLTALSGGRTS